MKFSLLTLLAATTMAAVACAALVKPSAEWLSVIVTLCACTWSVQVLRTVLQIGVSRAAAAGWLLFATAYVALVFGPWTQQRFGPLLVTSQAIGAGQQRWFAEQRINVNDLSLAYVQAVQPQPSPYGVTFVVDSNTQYAALQSLFGVVAAGGASPTAALFQVTGHWLCAWLAGWLGAILAATYYRRGQVGGRSSC